MIFTDILIIGGGASGILSAIVCHDYGKQVMVVEAENRIGKKILVTGNGRCNFSNEKIKPPFSQFHSENRGFFQSVLNDFSVKGTVDLFQFYGLPIITLDEGKMYPQSLQASSVVDLFLMNLEERDIPVYLNSKVKKIIKKEDYFIVETNNEDNPLFQASKVLIACGGLAAPNTGSDGSILNIMKTLGHSIIKPLPSIVQLKLDYPHLKALSGVRFDCLAKVMVDNKIKREEYDEVLFTNYGISGPAILQLSRHASLGLEKKQKVSITLDLFSNQSEKALSDDLEARFALFGHRSIFNAFNGVIHKKLIPIILKDSGISNIHKPCDSITFEEKRNLLNALKNWTFTCNGTNGFNNAQTTIGGVNTKEVSPKTLESKLISNLYFAGEVLDVDGDCGGYNLQWAWSSGYVAAKNISQK